MEPYEHLAGALKLVNASMFQKNMETVKLPEEQELKKFRVTYSGSDIVKAKDEWDAESQVMDNVNRSDLDYEVEELTDDKPTAVTVENGCTKVHPQAKRYLVTLVHKQYYHVPIEAMNEDDASEQVHNLSNLSDYLITDVSNADIYIDDIREVQP